jgi:hypothetical protein
LTPYEKEVREQASAALKQLSRTARTIETRRELSDALAGLERRRERGWLLLFFSGHGAIERGVSQLCLADGNGAGKWLDIDQELLRALPKSLSGAVIVLDACSSANVDPHLAAIPTAVISASPYLVEPSALFGSMILSSLSAARDENCNGIFDDEDLFAGMTHRLRARLSTASLEVRPKLRRNAPSPLPIPVPARSSARCTQVATAAAAVASVAGLPEPLVEQRRVQDYLARGSRVLPRLDHDFFVVSGSSAAAVDRVRQLAKTTNLTELQGLTASQAALAAGLAAARRPVAVGRTAHRSRRRNAVENGSIAQRAGQPARP